MFPKRINLVMAVLNSQFADHATHLINPTFNLQVGDLSRLPMPISYSDNIDRLVDIAIGNAKADSEDDERSYNFIVPPPWKTGLDDVVARRHRLTEIEK